MTLAVRWLESSGKQCRETETVLSRLPCCGSIQILKDTLDGSLAAQLSF